MAEPHRESGRKGVASFKAWIRSYRLGRRDRTVGGDVQRREGRNRQAGKSRQGREARGTHGGGLRKLAGEDEVEEIEAALGQAFEAGVALVLGDEKEESSEDDDEEESAFRQLLIGALLKRDPVRSRLLHQLLLRRLLLRRLLKRGLRQ